jgi:hypothetical protein
MEDISIETLREILQEIKTKNIFDVRFTEALEANFSFEM